MEPDPISSTFATLHQPFLKATANRYMFIPENIQLVNKGFKATILFTSIAGIIKMKLRKRRRNGKSWSNLAFDQLVVWCKQPE